MQYYRCKCGKRQAWGSMGPSPCSGCLECNTTLEQYPSLHKEPKPHEMIATTVETDEGEATLSRCKWCYRSKKELEER